MLASSTQSSKRNTTSLSGSLKLRRALYAQKAAKKSLKTTKLSSLLR
jgi:hypothetical protein